MYYGKSTTELMNIRKQYRDIFGYDPNGAEDVEFADDEYNEYLKVLKTCIKKKQDMFEILGL